MTKADIKVNGRVYDGWKSTSIKRGIEHICSVFNFDFTDTWSPNSQPWGINPQDNIDIEIAGTRLIRGYAEVLDAKLDADRTYSIQGRDKSCDVVDCSATVKQYKNISLLDLCNAIAGPVGVKFTLQNPLINNEPFANFAVCPGEKMFECIDKAVRQRSVLCIPDGSGSVVLSLAGTAPALVALVEGENCKAVGYKLDYSKRHSTYSVVGQKPAPTGWPPDQAAIHGDSSDEGVKRPRPLIIHAEKTVTSKEAKDRAAWEATVRAARSTVVTVEVASWLQAPGVPWVINQLVQLRAKRLGVSGTFLISEIEYTQSGRETKATMTLVPPDSFLSNPKIKKKKSDQVAKGWSV